MREKLRYRFDDFMSRGSSSGFIALTVVFTSFYLVIAIARMITVRQMDGLQVERGQGLLRQIWIAFLEMTDPGSMTQDIDSHPWVKVFAVLAGMTGLVLLSALIAVITNALDQRLSQLRKGHSRVVLDDHTLILGWNDRVVDVLRELILANESEPSAAVVILADRPKEEMDDQLALLIPDRRTTKIVTRSGVESSLTNLNVASTETCRSVIALASCASGASLEDMQRSDMKVVKTVLGVVAALGDRTDVPVVAELFQSDRRELVQSMGPTQMVALDADEMLAKILVQTSRNEGLSVVYDEILSFDRSEIYITGPRKWPTSTFGMLSYHMPDGVAIGLRRPSGEVVLNPDAAEELRDEDQVIVLATDDSTIAFQSKPIAAPKEYEPGTGQTNARIERELIIGWSAKLPTIVREYADYVGNGSRIDLISRSGNGATGRAVAELAEDVPSLELRLIDVDPSDTVSLLELRPFEYDNIIVLSDAGHNDAMEWADSETLLHLLQLQKIFREASGTSETKLIAELLDSDNRDLVTETGVREFVISNRFVSMLMAQISENVHMKDVYDNLLSEAGSEIYLKPLDLYLSDPPDRLRFVDLIRACQQRGEICTGLRLASQSERPNENFGIHMIPSKDMVVDTADIVSLVVLAEDEH